MQQQTGRRRWPWLARRRAGALGRCSCSTRLTSSAGRGGEARSSAAPLHTASRPPSASRLTTG
eukprot:10729571-Alexandrium_andersonii.AAC.1